MNVFSFFSILNLSSHPPIHSDLEDILQLNNFKSSSLTIFSSHPNKHSFQRDNLCLVPSFALQDFFNSASLQRRRCQLKIAEGGLLIDFFCKRNCYCCWAKRSKTIRLVSFPFLRLEPTSKDVLKYCTTRGSILHII